MRIWVSHATGSACLPGYCRMFKSHNKQLETGRADFFPVAMHRWSNTVEESLTCPDATDGLHATESLRHPKGQTSNSFRGLPPRLPLARDATFFAADVERTPDFPSKLPIQCRVPNRHCRSEGRYKSASSLGQC